MITDEQRQEFIRHCQQKVLNGKAIVKELEQIDAPEAVILREKRTIAGYAIVLADLQAAETIGE